MIVSKFGQISMKPSSRKDLYGICGRKTMANAVLCRSCENFIHGRCARTMMMTNTLAIDFKCRKCNGCHINGDNHEEKLHEDLETVTDFSYLGDGIYSGSGCEASVAYSTRLRLVRLGDCQDVICGKKILCKSKEVHTNAA